MAFGDRGSSDNRLIALVGNISRKFGYAILLGIVLAFSRKWWGGMPYLLGILALGGGTFALIRHSKRAGTQLVIGSAIGLLATMAHCVK